ncbi:hypothetical protein ASPWEDRAFT_176003 [Aspergillus wentii DTO 134E9]|uniref:Uncharacterized protein n=1 Tax=Aspergillus wentii DTO 134E9 TaxID=1073089 RepID=A0A1L9R7L1_ASPWE|nr:uncharacterized protein ASPWEDRAFT_176003 [Aspergillus wentii DTO 134E9]KAI9927522.1 Transient receptor putative cation channel sub A member 1 [Aspergillus wentii]OJJ30901.1 hypothetical protein ASPWEDRAFT_176003 [Aspergillus wentii DTO 134E9]
MARDDCWLDAKSPKSGDGRSVLSHAAECGQEDIVKIILQETEIGRDFEDEMSRTPLSRAAENGHDTIVEMLLASGADIDSRDDKRYGLSPLWYAIRTGRKSTFSLLVKHHATVKPTVKNEIAYFTLPSAEDVGSDFTELLLLHGIAFRPYDVSNESIPSVATENGDWDSADSLITHEIDVKSKYLCGRSWLAEAAERGDEILVRKLLSYNPDTESDEFYVSPIYKAVKNGYGKIVELLLDHGALPDLSNHYWRGLDNLLFLAAREGHTNVVRQLLSYGADPDGPIEEGESLIYQGAENGWGDIAHLLLSHDADPNLESSYGNTALFATKGKEMAKILLQYGADPNIQSSKGASAGEVLRENGIFIEEIHKEASVNGK